MNLAQKKNSPGAIITSIEKRYFLRSSQVGFIFACYEMGGTLLILVVSYYGHRHKSKWLGLGSLGFGLGCLVFASPQLMVGEYEPVVAQTSDLCQLNKTLRNITDTSQLNCRSSDWYHLFVFIFGQVLIGAAGSPIYNLGAAYIDENVLRNNSGVYLGVFYAVSTLGPGIGFLLGGYFLTIYVDITLPDDIKLEQDDKNWIGAWWLGYVFAGICAILASIPLLGFPREIPRTLSDENMNAEDLVPDEEKPHTTKELLPALKRLLTNKIFLFATIAGASQGLAVSGASIFFPKFLESQFQLRSSDASFFSGIVIIPGGIIGMLLGGYLIRRFQWTCGQCIKACSVISFLVLFPSLIFLVHCPNKDLAGVTTSYFNRTFYGSLDVCSTAQNCSCKQNNYVPICTKEDQTTYFSPCHAGCEVEMKRGSEMLYTNCSCLPPNISVAYDGGCVQSCNSMAYFLAIIFLLIVIIFLNYIPAITVTLRCVPKSQGSFALGVQQIISRIFAFIPAPIIYGALLDSVCVLPGTDPCDEDVDRNCLEYKNDDLSYVLFAATMICNVVSLLSFTMAWLVYKPRQADPLERKDELAHSDNTDLNTEWWLESTL